MNWKLIKLLVGKDLYFNRKPLIGYAFIAIISLLLLGSENSTAFYAGMVLEISIVIVIGIHLVFATVVNERKEQTLAFTMSLPVTYMEFNVAKLVINVGVFTLAWLAIYQGTKIVIDTTPSMPNGLLPFTTLVLLQLFVNHMIVLSIAMVGESETWTVVIMSLCNVSVSFFMYVIASNQDIGPYIEADSPVWNTTIYQVMAGELLIIFASFAFILYFQSRKKDFL